MEIVPATPERWDDLADLFTRRGPRGGLPMTAGCWCMWWRRRTGEGSRNRAALRRLVRGGREPGLLAYDGGRAIGWVAVAPRAEYGQLVRSRVYSPAEPDDGAWAVTCFFVGPGSKRQGVAAALLEGAVRHAFARGAPTVEAYPHVRGDYMGVPSMFERLGFEAVRRAGPRTIVRLSA